uniref:ACT domain-containing protein n=1 Tax=Syphacia muris TaxID=451379 RepID=A0A0N5AHP9_9BILA
MNQNFATFFAHIQLQISKPFELQLLIFELSSDGSAEAPDIRRYSTPSDHLKCLKSGAAYLQDSTATDHLTTTVSNIISNCTDSGLGLDQVMVITKTTRIYLVEGKEILKEKCVWCIDKRF